MKKVFSFIQILGVLLLILCLVISVTMIYKERQAREETPMIVETINSCLPERYSISIEDYAGNEMPALEIDGNDYVCLIEITSFGIELPVARNWKSNDLTKSPCRFWGSIYNNDLIIGGKNQIGQFEFCEKLDIGEKISITDMRGAQFTFVVQKIERSSDVSFDSLSEGEYSLSLFTKDRYDENYIIVRCGLPY